MIDLRAASLAGVLALAGGLGVGTAPVLAQSPGGGRMAGASASTTAPGYYTYRYGPNGLGYYYTSVPSGIAYAAPSPARPIAANPANNTVGGRYRDWPSGRNLPLAKPWLRPMR